MTGFPFANLARKHRTSNCDQKSAPFPFQPALINKDPAPHITPFPINLPIDLGRYIIELSARHDPRTACQLLLVSRQVHDWVKPLLCSFILADDEHTSARVMRAALKLHTPEKLRLGVQTFGVQLGEAEESAQFLQICVNIKDLAIWSNWDRYLAQLTFHIQNLRPRTVTLPLVPVFGQTPDFRQPFFGDVTHLVVYDAPFLWAKWTTLHYMPSLTHLAYRFYSYSPSAFAYLRALLKKCINLEQLVIFTGPDFNGAAGFDKKLLEDDRFVLTPIPNEHRDWEDFVTGGTSNVWAYAKRITSLKRRMRNVRSYSHGQNLRW